MQRYLTRWQGRVRCDDEELYDSEGLCVEWLADGTCVVRPRDIKTMIHEKQPISNDSTGWALLFFHPAEAFKFGEDEKCFKNAIPPKTEI